MQLKSWMMIILLVGLNITPKWARALSEAYFTREKLPELVIANGCSSEEVKSRDVFLKSPLGQNPDQILYCSSSCGKSGCYYFVFLRNQDAFDLYRFAGSFSGHYKVLDSVHDGYFDLKIKEQLGAQQKREHTLRFKNHEYR